VGGARGAKGDLMGVRVDRKGDIAVVAPEGNFYGGKETDELELAIKELQAAENKKMVLDLGRVSHLNSIAIGLLVSAHTNYQKRGGRILLANVDKRIQNVFVVTKLSLVFELADSREDAVKALGA
jgi:anti-anti-sigma factor